MNRTQSHNIVVRDFGPGGTGVNVVVHRLGCDCRSVHDRKTVIGTYRVEAHEDEQKRAGIIARQFGLPWYDFAISDCTLGI